MLKLQSRSPRGERGLKYGGLDLRRRAAASLPARGAWVEMPKWLLFAVIVFSRSPRGERGLK